MDSSHLHPDQLQRLLATLSCQRDYLHKLIERMRVRRFAADDPINLAALAAYEKCSNLCVVVATARERLRGENTIMTQMPWAGDR